MKRKIKIGNFPSLVSLAEQFLQGDREEKQIIWLELKDGCEPEEFTAYDFFDNFCENKGVGPYKKVSKKKKQKEFSKKDLRKRNKERG